MSLRKKNYKYTDTLPLDSFHEIKPKKYNSLLSVVLVALVISTVMILVYDYTTHSRFSVMKKQVIKNQNMLRMIDAKLQKMEAQIAQLELSNEEIESVFFREINKLKSMMKKDSSQNNEDEEEEEEKIEPYVQTLQLSPQHKKHFYLVIAIGTIPRIRNDQPVDYLEQTVRKLVDEIKAYRESPSFNTERDVIIYVQSHVSGHVIFDKLRYDDELRDYVVFADASAHRFNDPFEDIPGHDYTHPDNTLPGRLARQQNCDVISFSENAIHNLEFTHFLFMEDDFLVCEKGIINLINALDAIDRKTANKGYCGLYVGYGMSGIAMPREQLISFTKFTKKNINRLPIDLLVQEFMLNPKKKDDRFKFCKQHGLQVYTYRNVLMEHIGETSTFKERNKSGFRPKFPRCGTHMSARVWNLPREAWYRPQCHGNPENISPC